MNRQRKNLLGLMLMLISFTTFAQTKISGKVTDAAKEPIIGANISIKGTAEGTITDIDGNFELSTEQATPFTIVVSMVGMANAEKEITGNATDLSIQMSEETNVLNTIVVSASRVEEKILESPVTIEKMDQKMVKQSSSNDYYDDLSKLKGVQVIQGSMTLTSVNTRGFGGIANTRFVQLMDGMDNAAPLLNFPTGNVVGIGELDIQNVELVPGAASALYGPNAFNGILLMNSKNPFESPGFSAQVKGGFAQANNGYGIKPLGSVAMRVGHVWKRKGAEYVAIKFNANAFQGTDWSANDYTTGRIDGDGNISGPIGSQGFDGLNLYGDETNIFKNAEALVNFGYGLGATEAGTIAAVNAGVTAAVTAAVNANTPAITAGVTQFVRTQVYNNAIAGGADDATANAQADAFIASPTGQAQIAAGVAAQKQTLITQGVAAQIALRDIPGRFDSIQPLIDQFVANGLRRDGISEDRLLNVLNDRNKATSFKGDIGVYYRPFKDKSYEFSYNYRIGYGNSVYQGAERYALRGFTQQFHKAEIKGKDFFVRSYMSQTNAGNSFNHTALATFTYEANPQLGLATSPNPNLPSIPQWFQKYAGTLLPNIGGVVAQQSAASLLANDGQLFNQLLAVARDSANATWNALTTEQQDELIRQTNERYFKKSPPGSRFIDNSRLFHTEAMVDLSRWTSKIIDVQVGGNHRMYSLYTDGTVFDEDPDGDGTNSRINIQEYGAYLQLKRKLFKDMLTLQGSIRYDKNQNFKGIWSPRVAAVLTFGKDRNHNIRASYQTGFRNPDTQAQYINFPSGSGQLLGGIESNAGKYGIFNGGAWTRESYNAFVISRDSSLLKTEENLTYVKPEKLQVVELGYKAIFAKKLLLDLNGYFNMYDNFIDQIYVNSKDSIRVNGVLYNAGTGWYPYTNRTDRIYSYGAGIGVSYVLPKNMLLKTSYNYMDYKVKGDNNDEIRNQLSFQASNHQVYVGLSGDKVWKGLGFAVDYRWQSAINFVSSFASGTVKQRGVLDANLTYTIDKIYTQIKVGATNIAGPTYRTNVGGPFIGRTFYVGLTFDQGKKWRQNSQAMDAANTAVAY
jgi:outer membrane receptor protein involved in Fe transport